MSNEQRNPYNDYWQELGLHYWTLNKLTKDLESAEKPDVEQIRRNLETMTSVCEAIMRVTGFYDYEI